MRTFHELSAPHQIVIVRMESTHFAISRSNSTVSGRLIIAGCCESEIAGSGARLFAHTDGREQTPQTFDIAWLRHVSDRIPFCSFLCTGEHATFVPTVKHHQRNATDLISFALHAHSSRSNVIGSSDRARRAGMNVATSPSRVIARTTPVSTTGSRGVA